MPASDLNGRTPPEIKFWTLAGSIEQMTITIADAEVSALLVRARRALSLNESLRATQLYSEILAARPHHLEAVEFVASALMASRHPARALSILEEASRFHVDDADLARALGLTHQSLGDHASALAALARACKLAPHDYIARLAMGEVQEGLGRTHDALTCYFGALTSAQMQGAWVDELTTPPALIPRVVHAAAFVRQHRPSFFSELFRPFKDRYGADEMQRIERGLMIYLNEIDANYPDARQRPLFFYVPGLPTRPFFERDAFPWLEAIELSTPLIRDELLGVMQKPDLLEPFHASHTGGQSANHIKNTTDGTVAAWDTYFFHRHGSAFADHLRACPATAKALDAVPLTRIREHAPEALFSILRPGTHILPHRGVTNTRLVAHLPLVVPRDCAIVVGGETHVWEEGQIVIFDDTFEHEAWNRSGEDRAILLMDIWNPHLSDAECQALSELIPLIGDFNRSCGIN